MTQIGDPMSARGISKTQAANESVLSLDQWKEQCLAELKSRQRDADRAIRDQVTKIEDQRMTRER